MTAFYNEHDPYAAAWLRNLIAAGHIAPGVVDERSIEDVAPTELAGYRQCHFFAGIGIWSHALRAAGWPDERPVWTMSCPCQPFSSAGEGAGFADERHLWPAGHHLIAQRRPAIVFGEQVAGKDAMPWIDLVHDDMEALGYAFGAVPFPAAGVGAPHIRDRLYWVASDGVDQVDTIGTGLERLAGHGDDSHEPGRLGAHTAGPVAATGGARGLEHAARGGFGIVGSALEPGSVRHADGAGDAPFIVADTSGKGRRPEWPNSHSPHGADALRAGQAEPGRRGAIGGLADADGGNASAEREFGSREQRRDTQDDVPLRRGGGGIEPHRGAELVGPGPVNGHWRIADWLFCRDGKWRPVEPGTFPLAAIPARGVGPDQSRLLKLARSNRVGRLRGYGNGLNADAARIFIECVKGYLP